MALCGVMSSWNPTPIEIDGFHEQVPKHILCALSDSGGILGSVTNFLSP